MITLTTDFGLSDHYVGAMKGVILGICPQARIVDISHDVSAFEIAEGAFLLAQAYRYFPRGTVHVVVVDPGVGTSRRPILVEAAGQYFVAPDNGVLSMIYARAKHKVRLISNDRYFRQPVSHTFHGRDIFAPVAAHLAAGVAAGALRQADRGLPAPRVSTSRSAPASAPGPARSSKSIASATSSPTFTLEDFPDLDKRAFEMAVGPQRIGVLARNYAECGAGRAVPDRGQRGILRNLRGPGFRCQVARMRGGRPVGIDPAVRTGAHAVRARLYSAAIACRATPLA